ncbi:MAG: ribonuclease HI family protein [Patescibacteria group bacterium]
MEKSKIIIYTDGGARGNPGSAAIGVVIKDKSAQGGSALGRGYSKAIGETTNNVAEYEAVVFGLKKVKALIGGDEAKKTDVEIRSDSELVVSQLRGDYKIKEHELIPRFVEVWNLKQDFQSVEFTYVPREENGEADTLVNRALDTLL